MEASSGKVICFKSLVIPWRVRLRINLLMRRSGDKDQLSSAKLWQAILRGQRNAKENIVDFLRTCGGQQKPKSFEAIYGFDLWLKKSSFSYSWKPFFETERGLYATRVLSECYPQVKILICVSHFPVQSFCTALEARRMLLYLFSFPILQNPLSTRSEEARHASNSF